MSKKRRRVSNALEGAFSPEELTIRSTVTPNNRSREERKLKTRILLRDLILNDTGHRVPLDTIHQTKPKQGPWRIKVDGNDRSYPNTPTSHIAKSDYQRFIKFFKVRVQAEWVGEEDEYPGDSEAEQEEEDQSTMIDVANTTTITDASSTTKDDAHLEAENQSLREELMQAKATVEGLLGKVTTVDQDRKEVIKELLFENNILKSKNKKLEELVRNIRAAAGVADAPLST